MHFKGSLTTINDAVTLGATMRKYWFRGHATVVGKLTPKVFRPLYSNKIRNVFPPPVELNLIEEFRRRAPAVAKRPLPGPKDHLGWLTLMQHYRAPTRLLDWTENALVALYFVVDDTDKHKADGELWMMDPYRLYAASGPGYALPIAREDRYVAFVAREPTWGGSAEKLLEDLKMEEPPAGPIPVPPVQSFERIVAQQSTLTIHPKPDPEEGNQITDLLSEPKFLSRFRVPAGEKENIRQALEALGITAGRLFPDLDGLSRELEQGERTFGEPAKEPPELH